MTDITDKSLLRCTYKKSLHVFVKVVLYAAYAIDGLAAIVIGIYAAIWAAGAILPTGQWILERVCEIYNCVSSGLISLVSLVPWYVWVIIAGVLAIPVYSLLWCVSRELTEEDKSYSQAEVGIVGLLIFAITVLILLLYSLYNKVSIITAGGILATVCIIFGVIFVFCGCMIPVYHHYIIAPKKAKQETFVKVEMP